MKDIWAKKLGDRIEEDGTLDSAQYASTGKVPQDSILNRIII